MSFQLRFTDEATRQLKKIKEKAHLRRLALLLDDMIAHPFEGLGKPEALKYELSGFWSRRIDKKNRLIYEVVEPNVIVVSVLGHYD